MDETNNATLQTEIRVLTNNPDNPNVKPKENTLNTPEGNTEAKILRDRDVEQENIPNSSNNSETITAETSAVEPQNVEHTDTDKGISFFIEEDKTNGGYQVKQRTITGKKEKNSDTVIATFKSVEKAKEFNKILTEFQFDAKEQNDKISNIVGRLFTVDMQHECSFLVGIVSSNLDTKRLIDGNGKKLVDTKQKADSGDVQCKKYIEEAKAKKQDTFWGVQAPDEAKLAAIKLLKEQQKLTDSELIQPIEKLEKQVSELEEKIQSIKNFRENHPVLAKIFSGIISLIESNCKNKIRNECGKIITKFSKPIIDLCEKPEYQIAEIEGVCASDVIPGSRSFHLLSYGLQSTIYALLEYNGEATKDSLKNFADKYTEDYLLKAVRAIYVPNLKCKLASAFYEYWNEKHPNKPCPNLSILGESLNNDVLEYQELVEKENALNKKLAELEARRNILYLSKSDSDYHQMYQNALTAGIGKKVNELKKKQEKLNEQEEYIITRYTIEHDLNPEKFNINSRKQKLEEEFRKYKDNHGKLKDDGYVFTTDTGAAIMVQESQKDLITLKNLNAFAVKSYKQFLKEKGKK